MGRLSNEDEYLEMGLDKFTKPPCSVEGCKRLVRSGELCEMHKYRLRVKGDVGPVESLKAPAFSEKIQCTVDGCERKVRSGKFCTMHTKRFKRNGTTDRVRPITKDIEKPECSVEGCVKKAFTFKDGLCETHYRRLKKGTLTIERGPIYEKERHNILFEKHLWEKLTKLCQNSREKGLLVNLALASYLETMSKSE